MKLKNRKCKRYAIRQGHFSKNLFRQWKDDEAKRIMTELNRKLNL